MATKFPNGIYKVKHGDSLWSIVEAYNPGMPPHEISLEVERLAALNNIRDADYIVIDQTVKDTASKPEDKPPESKMRVGISSYGVLASDSKTAVVTWSWDDGHQKTGTSGYKVVWEYLTTVLNDSSMIIIGGNTSTHWYHGKTDEPKVEDFYYSAERSMYTIPDGATQIRVKISPTVKEGGELKSSSVDWTDWYSFYVDQLVPPDNPSGLTVDIDDSKLVATISSIDTDKIGYVDFALHTGDYGDSIVKSECVAVREVSKSASVSFDVYPGNKYYIRYRVSKNKGTRYSDFSNLEGPYYTVPLAPTNLTLRAIDETEIYISWSSVATAEKYGIRYSTEKRYLEMSSGDITDAETSGNQTEYALTGLESGKEYFFQVRAVNEGGESEWSSIQSIIIGENPAPPTTWSSVSTAIIDESVYLYWVHNSKDGSYQRTAILEINGKSFEIIIDEKDAEDGVTSMVELIPSSNNISLSMNGKSIGNVPYSIGDPIKWRVQTIGVTGTAGDWSIERTISAYAKPRLNTQMYVKDSEGNKNYISSLSSFPFYVSCITYNSDQSPISYSIDISASENYETTNNVGNEITVTAGTKVYSKHIDGFMYEDVEIGPGDINLKNNVTYILHTTVFMDSGLTADNTQEFAVSYGSVQPKFSLEAIVTPNLESVTTTIVPYCENRVKSYYKVEKIGNVYRTTSTELKGPIYRLYVDDRDKQFSSAKTETGETVYYGADYGDDENPGNRHFYHEVITATTIQKMLLSVYRREFDGSFTELSKDLPSENFTAVTDPHPSLDYARYRIVARSADTGEISYYDLPARELGVKYVVIQWDEAWSLFDYAEGHTIAKAPYGGSILKLPYNIDVSDSYDSDVTLVNYIGREHPVSYYGTQIGQTASWEMSVDKTDVETIYGLRRLARWMGDVYVREPSGSGYWARVKVSFNQKHKDPIVPVSLEITRVDGGV